MKERVAIVVVGHLNHGKSTLIGRLLYDSHNVLKDKVEEIRKITPDKKGIDFSLLLDSFQEERKGQFTLDTTQAILRTKKREYNFIDCPGHKAFIKNMLTGASQAECALFTVSARLNEGVEQQTRTHIKLAKLLGIEKFFVVISKMDAVSYKKERFLELKREMKDLLKRINFYKKTIFIPVSAKEGDNVVKKTTAMKWYKEKPLLAMLDEHLKKFKRRKFSALRILIQETYFDGNRRILLGKIVKGLVRVNDTVFLN